MFNSLNTSKAKKIRRAIKGERGYLLSLVYTDAKQNKPILMPKSIFNIFFDHLFLGKRSLLVNSLIVIVWIETILSILYIIKIIIK